MSDEVKSLRRIELLKKQISGGLTLTEAHELTILDNAATLVPWKDCDKHQQKYLYSSKCPICIE